MRIDKILYAIPVIQKLVSIKMPIQKSYELYMLTKKVEEKKEFFTLKEKELLEKYNANVDDKGHVLIDNKDDSEKFTNEYSELTHLEINDITPMLLKISDLGYVELSAVEIETLSGIINFES